MQASKIVPGDVYAIRRDGRLVRFVVDEVTTTRTKVAGPHGYSSTIKGRISALDGGDAATLTLDPSHILGPYAEQAELRQRADAEAAERKAKQDALEKLALTVTRWLYAALNQPEPDNLTSFGHGIRYYVNGVDSAEITIQTPAIRRLAESLAIGARPAARDSVPVD